MIRLTTKRLIIRDPVLSDFEGWHKLLSSPKVMYFIDDIMTHSKEQSRRNLLEAIEEVSSLDRQKYFLVIENTDSGEYIGNVGYTVKRDTPMGKIIELGYFILSEHQSKGYTTEAVREVIRFAFKEKNVYRIETGCYVENYLSENVMKKNGLIKEGHFVKCTWHDGQLKDRVSYRILKHEWEEKISNNLGGCKMSDCIFCKIVSGEIPSYTIYEDDCFKVILDRFPSSLGHVLIITKEHYAKIYELDDAIAEKLYPLAVKIANKLKKALNCDGINILQNNETAASQTVHHFHLHIIPRYENDDVTISWKPKDLDDKQLENMRQILS